MHKHVLHIAFSFCVLLLVALWAGLFLSAPVRAVGPAGEYTTAFPATGDTVNVAYNPYWWRDGDYAEGVRTPALAQVDGVVLNLVFGSNTLTCDTLDLDLYLNGSIVHSFSVASGETAITETVALATPTTTSTVTVRLQEDGAVATGCGSVVIPLDQSSITFIYAQGSAYFPELGDTVDVAYDPWWWSDGDAVEGVRDPDLSQVNGLIYDYQFDNSLKAPGGACGSGGEAAFQFSINGEPVGDFTLDYGDPDTGEVTLTFDPISAVTYTVRMEMVGAVASGCGSVEVPLHQSTLQLLDSRSTDVFPATGDTVDVTYDPWWWRSGDNVEGERLSALSSVNAISYTLHYTNDLKAIGGACTAGGEMPLALSVDDDIVATTTITPSTPETVAIIASFDPLSGLTHTLRLEETAQVASGCGNIEVPLDVSPFQFNDTWHSRYFPTVGDTTPADWDHVGNAAAGQREPGPTEVNTAVYTLRLGSNSLSGGSLSLALQVNGTTVGNLTVNPGDTFVQQTVNFAPITSMLYTTTLGVAGKSGSGSITIPYDRSTLRLANTLDSAFFPATGDLVNAPSNNWNSPSDAATGVRRPSGLTQVSALVYDLRAFTNTLTGTLNLQFVINGTPVGSLSVPTGTLRAETVLNFAPLTSASGIYTVTLETLNSAGGRVNIPLDRSRLTLGDPQNAATFPATGDTVNEGSSQGWNQVGDYAQGVRIPGVGAVNRLEYTLYPVPNTLSCTLTTTLKLNGVLVAVIPIVGGTNVYTISEDFTSISAGAGGRYTVTLTAVTNTLGCGHTHVPLNVSPLSLSYVASGTAGFTGSPLSGYPPLTVTFVATSTGVAGPAYAWNFGDAFTGTGKIIPHTYTLAGVYPVTLTVSGLGGPVTVTRPAYVTVNALISPTVAFTGTPTSGSAPLMVVFTSTTTGPVSGRLWDFGDGYTSTVIAPSHIYTASGVYTVSLQVSGPGGSASQTQVAYISVSAPSAPQADFSATPRTGTAPLTVTFTSVVTGSVTAYAWDFGDGGTSAAPNPVHVYANAGMYTVVFTATNAIGSTPVSKTNYITVSLPPAPVVNFGASPTSGPASLTVHFTGTVAGAATSYAWDFGDGGASTSRKAIHTYLVAGVYTVTFTATGPGGSGANTKSNYITVTAVGAAPEVLDFAATPISGTAPLVVAFTSTVSGTVTAYDWDFGDSGISDEVTPTHTYASPGIYTVTLTVGGPGGTDAFTRASYITAQYGIYLPLVLRDY